MSNPFDEFSDSFPGARGVYLEMRRFTPAAVSGLALFVLLTACFQSVFSGGQFGFRDAAHYYYPLYARVQEEWNAGRVPLWDTRENAGMPLVGNPTAAVLYPGKIIYAMLPYAWGARIYIIAHTILAFVGMTALCRHWKLSITGSTIGALSYAFGAPILFQYCNVIFLVGAAWTPLGIRAIDRWLREGNRMGLIELSVVLAMQTLGGDPQASYLLGLCGGGYAVGLGRLTRSGSKPGRVKNRSQKVAIIFGVAILLILAWTATTLAAARYLPMLRPKVMPRPALWFVPWIPIAVNSIWGLIGVSLAFRWIKRDKFASIVGPKLVGLGAAAILAGALSAAQLLPVLEFTRMSGRASGEGSHDVYPFSLEPYRAVEFLWPDFYGTTYQGNRSWLGFIFSSVSHRMWVPSLYLGGLPIILAVGTLGFKNGPPWRGWLTVIALVSFLGALGEFGSPLWWARCSNTAAAYVGPHDPKEVNAIREDGFLRDGDGGFYWMLATALPGFGGFRYPSKLLSLTILALSGLAACGWDRLGERADSTFRRRLLIASGLSGAVLGLTFVFASLIRAWLSATTPASSFGLFDPEGAIADTRRALLHGLVLFGILMYWMRLFKNRPRLAGALAILLTAIDLSVANARWVRTIPQAELEKTPKALEIIRRAEAANPAPGPYRIHRAPIWNPVSWMTKPAKDRVLEFVRWESDTLQPKHGLPFGVEYTYTQGVAELYDYEWFFGPFHRRVDAETARSLKNVEPNTQIVYYPRRGFDLWASRYFILPAGPAWTDSERGIASFMFDVETIYPDPSQFQGPDGPAKQREFLENEDMQILRNRDAYPRAWIVHDARFLKPIEGLTRAQRRGPIEELLFANDPFWRDPGRTVLDPRRITWIEIEDPSALAPYATRGESDTSEVVTFVKLDQQRIELDVSLNRAGFVVLADAYYPGWRLTIDGKPAEILRANRMMRGAAVPEGKHRLTYTYEPESFAKGWKLSLAGCVALGLAAAWARRPSIRK